jgi:hypothetical protein
VKKYYLHNGHETTGPFDREDLHAQKINCDTLVWSEDLNEWKKAGEVDELKVILQKAPIPPPISIKQNKQYKKPNNRNTLKYLVIVIFLMVFAAIAGTIISKNTEYTDEDIPIPADDSVERQIRNNITSLVHVINNQYSIDTFGGISNLDVIINNNSNYTLDQVTVAIDYIKKNGGIYKTENLTFNNIPAKQNISLSAPDSNRGVAVKLTIQTITSLELNLCYDYQNIPAVGNPDPFNCNQYEKNNPDHFDAIPYYNRSQYIHEHR